MRAMRTTTALLDRKRCNPQSAWSFSRYETEGENARRKKSQELFRMSLMDLSMMV